MMDIKPDCRNPTFEFNVLPKWDASCEVNIGETKVACGILGPTESKSSTASCAAMTVDVTVRPPAGMMTIVERHIESIITDLFPMVVDVTQFPYTQVIVCFEIACDAGSLLSAVINCFLATLQALKLPGKLHAYAVTCSDIELSGIFYPTLEEELASERVATCVLACESGHVLYCFVHSEGYGVDALATIQGCCFDYLQANKCNLYPQPIVLRNL